METMSLFANEEDYRALERANGPTFRVADYLSAGECFTPEEADQQLERWIAECYEIPRSRNAEKTILSLFDESCVWSAPYVRAGYNVVQCDINNGVDVRDLVDPEYVFTHIADEIHGVLAACPCTHFANSGARWFAEKDAAGITQEGIDLAHATTQIIDFFDPKFWVIENPVGRIQELCGLPDPRLIFQPHHFGDPYTKRTVLFGDFNPVLPTCNVEPTEGSRVHKLRGDVPEQKKQRSITPEGFAYAFFMANQP